MEQLKEDIASSDIELSQEIISEIDKMFTKNPNPWTF